ncbi:hypothetical protein RP20_CCG011241 [Aedes albopictus]|nr:hypothetical protein RP20_CCG011241 [Aedes albopictus]
MPSNQPPQPIPGPSSLGIGPRCNNVQPGVVPGPPPPPSMLQMQQQYLSLAYRNELYDRTAGYDVPRGGGAPRNNYYQNQQSMATGPRYQNLHLDLNRPRHSHNSMRAPRQRSFDDTESYHYHRYQNQNFAKYDNVYERVREEPAYQNTGSFGNGAAGPSNRGIFGRLDVIGHGVGRIERHLSSSCGNIDHYSLGGHYAVLGHSHLGTVGHIRLNPSNSNQPSGAAGKDSSSVNVKSFFSCLGGENSQSMNNISKNGSSGQPGASGSASNGEAAGGSGPPPASSSASSSTATKITGTIPKIRSKSKKDTQNSSGSGDQAEGENQVNRVSKPSLQWLLVNKWLPMWVGQTPPDYKFIDFNFMFSRNCDGCGSTTNHQELMRLDGQAEMRSHEYGDYIPPAREYPTMNGSYPRVLRNTPQLSRLREHEYENVPVDSPPGRLDFAGARSAFSYVNRARSESPSRSNTTRREERNGGDPFRNWAFNFEDNSFRPAGSVPRPREIRRITDGTFRATDFSQDNDRPGQSRDRSQDLSKTPPTIVVNESASPSTSRSNSASPPKSKESSVSPVQPERGGTPASSSSDSEIFVMDSVATDAGGPAEDSSGCGGGGASSSMQGVENIVEMGEAAATKEKEGASSQETSESSSFEDNPAESSGSDEDITDEKNVDIT